MNDQQRRLERIAREIDSSATVTADALILHTPNRRDEPLAEEWVRDHSDDQVADEIRLRWGLG